MSGSILKNELLFQGKVFHLDLRIEHLPENHIHVYVRENGVVKKYDFGYLQNSSYSNFYSVFTMFDVSMDRILKEASEIKGNSPKELKNDGEYRKFVEFLQEIKNRKKDA